MTGAGRARTSPKLRNLAADPRISVGIFAQLVGQASSRGVRLFGRAQILTERDDGFAEHFSVVR